MYTGKATLTETDYLRQIITTTTYELALIIVDKQQVDDKSEHIRDITPCVERQGSNIFLRSLSLLAWLLIALQTIVSYQAITFHQKRIWH